MTVPQVIAEVRRRPPESLQDNRELFDLSSQGRADFHPIVRTDVVPWTPPPVPFVRIVRDEAQEVVERAEHMLPHPFPLLLPHRQDLSYGGRNDRNGDEPRVELEKRGDKGENRDRDPNRIGPADPYSLTPPWTSMTQ